MKSSSKYYHEFLYQQVDLTGLTEDVGILPTTLGEDISILSTALGEDVSIFSNVPPATVTSSTPTNTALNTPARPPMSQCDVEEQMRRIHE